MKVEIMVLKKLLFCLMIFHGYMHGMNVSNIAKIESPTIVEVVSAVEQDHMVINVIKPEAQFLYDLWKKANNDEKAFVNLVRDYARSQDAYEVKGISAYEIYNRGYNNIERCIYILQKTQQALELMRQKIGLRGAAGMFDTLKEMFWSTGTIRQRYISSQRRRLELEALSSDIAQNARMLQLLSSIPHVR